jgi:anti-sigma factor RsiW
VTPSEARDLFSAAYEAELDTQQRAAFDALIADDAALASEYAEFCETLRDAKNELLGTAPLPDILPNVQRALRVKSRGRFYGDKFAERAGLGGFGPLLLGALTVGVLVLLWLSLSYFDAALLQR